MDAMNCPETPEAAQAREALRLLGKLIARRIRLTPGQQSCDASPYPIKPDENHADLS
jgi:hypothetical protein